MTLMYGGWNRYPLGAYTQAERDALDAAGEPDPPDGGSTFTIVDKGSRARYGFALRQIADGSRAGLTRELSTVGQALAIAGSYRNLPTHHPLRRWQPSYIGGHAVCVVVEGNDRLRWLDPLATNGYEGDVTDIATALAFAWVPSDARVARSEEWSDVFTDVPATHPFAGDIKWLRDHGITAGMRNPDGTLRYEPDRPVTRAEMAAFLHRLAREVGDND